MSFHECQKANFESYDPPVRSLRRQIWSQAPAAITQLPHDIHVGVCRDAHWCRRWRFLAAKFWEIMAGFATDLRGHIFCLLFCSRCTFCGIIKLTLIIKSCSKGRISSAWNRDVSTNKQNEVSSQKSDMTSTLTLLEYQTRTDLIPVELAWQITELGDSPNIWSSHLITPSRGWYEETASQNSEKNLRKSCNIAVCTLASVLDHETCETHTCAFNSDQLMILSRKHWRGKTTH